MSSVRELSETDFRSISLWHTGKKKAIFTQALAHGLAQAEGGGSSPRWITSLAALRGTDLFASGMSRVSLIFTNTSGSSDGEIRIWALTRPTKSFIPLFTIPAKGFVNSLQILSLPGGSLSLPGSDEVEKSKKQIVLVAAVGQEPRLGRWERMKEAKNGMLVVELVAA